MMIIIIIIIASSTPYMNILAAELASALSSCVGGTGFDSRSALRFLARICTEQVAPKGYCPVNNEGDGE